MVAYAFGSPWDILSNERLAALARDCFTESLAKVIFTQRELQIPFVSADKVEYISNDKKAEPTLRIARWAVRRAVEMGLVSLIVVAAEPHIERCVRDVRWAVREQQADAEILVEAYSCQLRFLSPFPVGAWFCSDSTQPHTRSSRAWWPRERLLRCMPMCLYTRVVGG